MITSLGAAALHDVLASLRRRAPHLRVIVYPSLVQGADAPAALVAALRSAGTRREVDTLLLVRGGGSLEDLWAFNDEALVRAIVDSPIPVVCGVGHESDITLADLAADLRAATPTAAAELAAPARSDALAQLDTLAGHAQRRLRAQLDTQAQRLDMLAQRLGGPARGLALQRQTLQALQSRFALALRQAIASAGREPARWGERMVRAMHLQLERRAQGLHAAAQRLDALDPQRVLARGYAWISNAQGQPVLSAQAVARGDRLRTVWADGSAQVEVLGVEASPLPKPTR